MQKILYNLFNNYPSLKQIESNIITAFKLLCGSFENGNKLLLCGNGGSASDCEHIAGELIKGFLLKRKLTLSQAKIFEKSGLNDEFYSNLQQGLPVISLTSHPAFLTAFSNDVHPSFVFAQQLFALGKKGDCLIAISTSGKSLNIVNTVKTAKALGISVIAMTGSDGGLLSELADVLINVPAYETYLAQELHLPVYHALCAMIEEYFFAN